MGVAVAALGVACIDMTSPKGVASISLLLVPSPSVVVGDVMRDSLGAPAPLELIAYDATGHPLSGVTPSFFITDSLAPGHLKGDTVVGDKFGLFHVIGQIGNLQTPSVPIFVTSAPTQIAALGQLDTLRAPFGTDSTTRGQSTPMVALTGASDSAAQGYIIHWSLGYVPPAQAGKQAVFLGAVSTNRAATDTTDITGHASMSVFVVTPYLNDPALATAGGVDSVEVFAAVSYRGAAVPGSPVRFLIPLTLGAISP
jgi:hypothetical protein